MRLAHLVFVAAVSAIAAPAQAQLRVQDPWVRATVAGQMATGAFMELRSAQPLKVLSVSSPAAAVAEIHEMKMADGVMRMRAVDALALPAGQVVALAPGGYHIMLMGLARPLVKGEMIELTLTFEKAGSVSVQVPVGDVAAGSHDHSSGEGSGG